MRRLCGLSVAMLFAACASTSVVPVSQNQIILSTSAAPACGRSGAMGVASRMAAVETLRRGFDGFFIQGAQADSDVRVVTTGPTYATTTGTATALGNQIYGTSRTTFGGQQTMILGGHSTDLAVTMVRKSEPAFPRAVDARQILGPDWMSIAKKGINTCVE